MNKLVIFAVMFITAWGATAQNRLYYLNYNGNKLYSTTQDTFPNNLIADDYGPRKLASDDNKWHGGIDFNGAGEDLDDLILAPEAGTIVDVNNIHGKGVRYVMLQSGNHRYAFVHMFGVNSTPEWYNDSTIFLTHMINQPGVKYALFINVNGTLHSIGQTNGQAKYKGELMDVSNSIAQYSPLGPIGGSTGYTPHLHLCTLPLSKDVISDTENKNPLEFIDYAASGYNIEVRSELNPGGITLKYPGTQITSLRIRPKLLNEAENDNRYNQIYDVNKVNVMIQKPGESTYEKLKGLKSDLEIDLGGKLGTTLKNHTKAIKGGADNYGSWTQYGINSFAYNTGATQTYDDFYFPDFVTRLHKVHIPASPAQYASCPAEAKYPDGRYKLKARVISISGDSTDSAVSPVLLDNYKPYISQVSMSVKGKQCYDAGWECAPCGGLKYAQSPDSPYSLDTLKVEGMRIRVKTSEPLANLQLTIAFYSKYNLSADAVSADSTEWIFNTGAVTDFNADSARVLRFTGTDLSGNSLMNLSGYKDAACVLPLTTFYA